MLDKVLKVLRRHVLSFMSYRENTEGGGGNIYPPALRGWSISRLIKKKYRKCILSESATTRSRDKKSVTWWFPHSFWWTRSQSLCKVMIVSTARDVWSVLIHFLICQSPCLCDEQGDVEVMDEKVDMQRTTTLRCNVAQNASDPLGLPWITVGILG